MLVTLIKHYLVTGVAQRKRAGLITLRSGVQITSPVLFQFVRFYRIEPSMLSDVTKAHIYPP